MIKEALAQFPHIWLSCIGLLIFLTVFLAVLFRVNCQSQRKLYEKISELPLEEEKSR